VGTLLIIEASTKQSISDKVMCLYVASFAGLHAWYPRTLTCLRCSHPIKQQ